MKYFYSIPDVESWCQLCLCHTSWPSMPWQCELGVCWPTVCVYLVLTHSNYLYVWEYSLFACYWSCDWTELWVGLITKTHSKLGWARCLCLQPQWLRLLFHSLLTNEIPIAHGYQFVLCMIFLKGIDNSTVFPWSFWLWFFGWCFEVRCGFLGWFLSRIITDSFLTLK